MIIVTVAMNENMKYLAGEFSGISVINFYSDEAYADVLLKKTIIHNYSCVEWLGVKYRMEKRKIL